MKFAIEVKREEDGRWYAVAEEVNGAMVYGETRANASPKSRFSPCGLSPIASGTTMVRWARFPSW